MRPRSLGIQALSLPLAIASGVALAFAMPPHGFSLAGWAALAPLLVAARITRPVYAAGLGMIAAFVCGLTLSGGRATEAYQLGNLITAFGGLAIVFAFVSCASSCAAPHMLVSSWIILTACAGVCAEMLSRYAFPVTLAISQHSNPAALRIASYAGVWGVGFLLWLSQAALAVIWVRPRAAVAALAAVAIAMGTSRCVPRHDSNAPSIRVAAVQAPDPVAASALISSVQRARVIVWPEHLMSAACDRPQAAARRARAYVVASVEEEGKGKPYNAAWLIDPRGRRVATARKQHLFGREKYDFRRGRPSVPARCPGFRPGIAICYDTQFTDIARDLVVRGADVVLVPNHDPLFPNFLFHHLHSAVIPFRAAENGVPIVWSEANALSMIVGPDGRVIARAPAGEPAVVQAEVRLRRGTTLFARIGDLFAYMCLGPFAVLGFMGVKAAASPQSEGG